MYFVLKDESGMMVNMNIVDVFLVWGERHWASATVCWLQTTGWTCVPHHSSVTSVIVSACPGAFQPLQMEALCIKWP